MHRHDEIQVVLNKMVCSKIIDTGTIECISECGIYFDYEKDEEVHRFVLGYNDLGGWIEYDGKLSDFSLDKCQTAH